MRSNRLQLNTSKTEVGLLWCSTSRRRHLLPTVKVSVDYVTPSSAVRGLGIMIDSDVSMRSHVAYNALYPVASRLYASSVVRSIPTIRIRLCLHVAIVVSLIMPRLHYGNATLAVLLEYQRGTAPLKIFV